MITSVNPYTGEEIFRFLPHSKEETAARIARASRAFESWKKVPVAGRCQLMERAGELLRDRTSEFARTITLEMGKPIAQARAEVEKCAWVCDYYARQAPEQLKPEPFESDAASSFVRYDPLGVILGVMPWNYPFWQVFRFAAPTLCAGNAALLKHASNVWQCGDLIEEVFREAGFPDGAFLHLKIGSKEVPAVIDHPAVRAVSLTGSKPAGSAVASRAGNTIKKSVLELGGSNALVVFEDANLDASLETCIQARFQNTGQSCIAGKRLLLHKEIATEFSRRLCERVAGLSTGDPMQEDTFIAVLAREDLAEDLERQMNASVQAGARIATGGKRRGTFFEPTVLLDVTPGMPAFDQETFGPMLAVSRFGSEQEAVELVNNSQFGLGVSLFTSNTERAQRMIPLLNEGAVFINELVKSDPRLPFGGVKNSGYGRELSREGIREFVNKKTVYFSS